MAACTVLMLAGPAFADDGALIGSGGGGIDWAEARRFWSLEPPAAREPPGVRDGRWPRRPLDRFVLARLEEAGLAPSPEAAPRTLIRRVTFDLTGLPPAPEDVEAFAAGAEADRYERLVDRLLASPRFGERMASLWLPLARYAEDQAHQVGDDTKFFYPNAHLYRQWVIDAFNQGMPYDRFVRLQLAADGESDARPGDLAALGFLGLGPKYYNRNRLDVLATEWEDRVDTVTRALLGLTVACARCHDHKFEPITTADYYALAGVFASTKMVNRTPDGKPEKGDTKADKMDPATLHIVEDGEAKDLHVFVRGNPEDEGPLAKRRFLRLLSPGEPEPFHDGSGRKDLAAAIASRENPLTARVLVNRVWGLLLGKPLVATPSNFGRSGAEPSHPELLDDLAARFMDGGWSVKALVREIVLSATYCQASAGDAAKAAVDPANRLLWRAERRRLQAEEWRDAALAVSGELEEGGGPSMEVSDPANRRRTVHARVSRLKLDDFLLQFDYPDANVHAEARAETTTAIQKLFVLNSPFMLARARALAARLAAEEAAGGEARVRRAHRLLFGRDPEPAELDLALEFLARPDPSGMTRWEEYAHVLLAANEMMYLD
jgi:hypothetical protein